MTLNRTVMTILIAVFVALGIPALFLFWKKTAISLTPVEKELISFSSKPIVVSKAKQQKVFAGLESPVIPLVKATPAPVAAGAVISVPATAVIRKTETVTKKAQPVRQSLSQAVLPTVSMVYSDGATMMALIDGHVLREGSVIGDIKVLKIEQKRVQINANGKNVWLDVN